MSKQFYLPMRDANHPHKVTLIPVSEEVYTNITPETNRIRSRRQYHGQCCCPKQYLWKCDGDCDVCEYRAAGDNLSLDYETEMHGDTFADTSDTEEIVTDQILMRQLLERLKELMVLCAGAVRHIHDHKPDALEDLIEAQNGKPVLIAYWYKHERDSIMERFDCREIKTDADIANWNAGKIPIALIQPSSAGHGLNLQDGGSTIIWYTMPWSLELYQQTNARLWRQGQQSRTVVIHHLVSAGTIDEDIMKVLENKDKTQAAMMKAVKARVRE